MAYETTVVLVRGSGTNDRDKFKTDVSADSLEELDERVRELRDMAANWADDYRQFAPERGRKTADDQQELKEVTA